jgi:exodeoxyribonuclease VII large subunit
VGNAKSQWDFGGELFPVEQVHRVLTVSELTGQVRRLLEKEIGHLWVTGEVSNLREQSSGHIYFTLKDAAAQLSCVLFRNEPVRHREYLEDGQKVVLNGDFSVFEARGQYQLIVRGVELRGMGALQAAFEKLKRKLEAEGLFAAERKRPIPRYPLRIGLVTSPTGAAIRDVLHVIERRHAGLQIILAACRVQGTGAAQEIASALDLLNEWSSREPKNRLDVILLTRGGGSLEDLWAFNEESVVRAIVRSVIPVISAVGHEIDFTISDFVADLRAATPSAAAEILTQGFVEAEQRCAELRQKLRRCAQQQMARSREYLGNLSSRLLRVHPRRVLQERIQYVDDLQQTLLRCVTQRMRNCSNELRNLQQRLQRVRPSAALARRRQELREWHRRLLECAKVRLARGHHAFANASSRLRLLSPDNVLARGYSISADEASGRIIRSAAEVKKGQKLLTRVQHGEIGSVVKDRTTNDK